jgi:hypothetical protein
MRHYLNEHPMIVDRTIERRRNGEDPTPHKETERSSDGR